MKNRAVQGDTIFYDIYTDAEKSADPAKNNTGLFFFKGEKTSHLPSVTQAAASHTSARCTTVFLMRWS